MMAGVVNCTGIKDGLLYTTKLHYKDVSTNQVRWPFFNQTTSNPTVNSVSVCNSSTHHVQAATVHQCSELM